MSDSAVMDITVPVTVELKLSPRLSEDCSVYGVHGTEAMSPVQHRADPKFSEAT